MTTPPFDPGAIHLRLTWAPPGLRTVVVHARRPSVAASLRGLPADQAVRRVPLLYAVCGAAQGAAARLALAAAQGIAAAPAVDDAVLAEARREHLFRLLLDWPRTLGLAPQEALLAAGCQRLRSADFAAWAEPALAATDAALAAVLDMALDTARAGLAPLPASGTPLLPPLDAAATLACWPRLDAAFAAAPRHGDAPAETGALARFPELQALPPLLARVRARRADLGADLGTGRGLGRISAVPVAPGIGRAVVETARGLLMHEITLAGDQVADYAIVAPTEWNFHPQGALVAWLRDVPAASADELRAHAARAVLALDPCVPCRTEFDGAD